MNPAFLRKLRKLESHLNWTVAALAVILLVQISFLVWMFSPAVSHADGAELAKTAEPTDMIGSFEGYVGHSTEKDFSVFKFSVDDKKFIVVRARYGDDFRVLPLE